MAALKTGSGGNSSAGAAMDDGKAARKYHQQSKHIGAFSHFIAGGVAGAVSKTCTAPLARLTILFQVWGFLPLHHPLRFSNKAGIFFRYFFQQL